MERTRELYMDINVSGRNFECKNEILTLKPENTVEVLDAFFAESKIEKVYEGKEDIYTVKAGDSLGSIAKKKGTTVDAIIASDPNITAQNKGDIKVGQKIKIASQKEKGENITFKRINKASIGKEVYIIVNTKDFESGTLKINIKQGKEEGILAQDNVIPVTIEDKRKQTFEVKVGSMSSSDYLNKNDYCDMAIVKITMDPANKEDLKSWNDKLENLEGKKTKLYLLIDAHSGNTDKEIIYHGQNPDKDGKPDTSTKKNYWLDMETKWFELKKKTPIIVLDPGHGYLKGSTGAVSYIYTYNISLPKGQDPQIGTSNVEELPQYVLDEPKKWIISKREDPIRSERFLVYDVALELKELLKNEGITVLLTRNERGPIPGSDDSATRKERIDFANDNSADYFISIHADGATSYASGAHVIYPKVSDADTVHKSKELALDIFTYYNVVKVESGSPKEDIRGLQILRNSNNTVRKVLVELGFVTSPSDAKALFSNIEKIANQISKGIIKNINEKF